MGVRLLLFHPEFDRTCADCQRWIYDDDGQVLRRPAREGKPVIRLPMQPTPCEKCPKIPKGEVAIAANAVEMTEQNRQAFIHYLECRAVGQWPDDVIVRQNARIIRQVFDEWERQPLRNLLDILGKATSHG